MSTRRSNTSKMAAAPASPPISSRIRKRGPSNADESKQTKPKTKKQRPAGDSDNEEEGKEEEIVKKQEKKGKKGKNR